MKRIAISLVLSLLTLLLCLHQAVAIDVATGPLGSNIQAVRDAATQNANETRTLGWNLNGAGVNLGQVEGGRPGDPSLFDATITVAELNHPAINPGGVGVIGVAIAGTTAVHGTDNNVLLSGHATEVAGMMVAQNAGGSAWGAAPGATLFSSAFATPNPPAAGQWAQQVVASSEWLRSRPGGVTVVNHSYGLTPADSLDAAGNNGVPNGNHLQVLYFDWSAVHNDLLHVIAGDENFWRNASIWALPSPQPRTDTLIIDNFNGIVVGATQQRRAFNPTIDPDRFDEVSNWSNSNMTADGRVRTDIVAPGGASQQVRLRARDNTGTPATNPNFGFFIGPPRNVNVFPANNNPVEDFDTSAPNVFTALGTGYDPNMPTLLDNNGDGALDQLPPAPMDAPGMATAGGTSFAAPQVAAVAGLMQQLRPTIDHRIIKAALLNSASKHVLSKPVDTDGDDLANANGQSWTQRYENRNAANPLNMAAPRDADIGFGQLNGLSAIKQIAQSPGNSAVSWGSTTVPAFGSVTHNLLVGGETLKPGSLVTATIAWDRIVNTTMANPTLAQLQNPANYTVLTANNPGGANQPISDVDLVLVHRGTGNPVAASRAVNDNVEHIYFNIREEGHYDLVYRNFSNRDVSLGVAFSAGTSNGLAFTVDGNAQGKQMPRNTVDFSGWPNDVNSLGIAGQGYFDTGGEIFTSSLNGTNMQRVSGGLGTKSRVGPHLAVPAAQNLLDNSTGALGLVSGDQLTGLSWGRDGSLLNNVPSRSVFTFSVDALSVGVGAVAVEAAAASHPGDIFKSPALDPFGVHNTKRLQPAAPNSNAMHIQEHQLGLWAPNAGASLLPHPFADNLRDFEFDNILDYTDTDGDGMINNDAYFALGRFSPTVRNGGASASDILVAIGQDPSANFDLNGPAGGFSFNVFAPAAVIGLQPGGVDPFTGLPVGDAIDALILSRTVPNIPHYNPLLDQALFSLDPLSASVLTGFASAAAIYYTDFARPFQPNIPWTLGGSLFASPDMLGLGIHDNIDGLDIFAVPEPATLALTLLSALLLLRRPSLRLVG